MPDKMMEKCSTSAFYSKFLSHCSARRKCTAASDYTTDRLAAEYAVVPLPCENEDPLAQEMAKLIPLAAALEAKIAQQEQQWLLTEVEQPLAEVLASMELIGFSLDTQGLTAYGQELDTQLTARAEDLYELAAGPFHQVGAVFFQRDVGAYGVVAGDGGGFDLAQLRREGGFRDAVVGKDSLCRGGACGEDTYHQVLDGEVLVAHGLCGLFGRGEHGCRPSEILTLLPS